MSLDITFLSKETEQKECYHCGSTYETRGELHWQNITHNLGSMAEEAGFYQALWRGEEIGVDTPEKLLHFLDTGIRLMKSDPDRFKKFDADNGWGTYDQFLPWLEELIVACREYPDAIISRSR